MQASPNHVLLQPTAFGKPIPWYEPTERARDLLEQFPDFAFSHLEWESYIWPGGYEITYVTHGGGSLCHQCANTNLELTIDPDAHDWYIVAGYVNWEGPTTICDHCGRDIESAYGDPSEEAA